MGHRRAPRRDGLEKGQGLRGAGPGVFDDSARAATAPLASRTATCRSPAGSRRSDLNRAVPAMKRPDGVRTPGPNSTRATTLWDYINRAMPLTNPQSLTADEVYAVTAYVLDLNEILPAEAELNDGDPTPGCACPTAMA